MDQVARLPEAEPTAITAARMHSTYVGVAESTPVKTSDAAIHRGMPTSSGKALPRRWAKHVHQRDEQHRAHQQQADHQLVVAVLQQHDVHVEDEEREREVHGDLEAEEDAEEVAVGPVGEHRQPVAQGHPFGCRRYVVPFVGAQEDEQPGDREDRPEDHRHDQVARPLIGADRVASHALDDHARHDRAEQRSAAGEQHPDGGEAGALVVVAGHIGQDRVVGDHHQRERHPPEDVGEGEVEDECGVIGPVTRSPNP